MFTCGQHISSYESLYTHDTSPPSADRAKSIKTKAVINESETDKLIRELKEENAKLLEMLKNGNVNPNAMSSQSSSVDAGE